MSPQVYLVIGKERFLKREFLDQLRRRLFADGATDSLNAQEFSAEREPLCAALDFVTTLPFGASKRLAVLWEADKLSAEEKKNLLVSARTLPSSGVLAVISDQTSAKKDGFLSGLSQIAELITCHTPFDKDLPSWVQTRARKSGLRADPDAVRLLIERVGNDVAALSTALEQLAVFIHPRPVLTAADVQNLLGKSAQENVFRLLDLILDSRAPSAVRLLEGLFREGTRSAEIIGALAGQLDRLKKCRWLLQQNRPSAVIGAELGVPPSRQSEFFALSKKASEPFLRDFSKRLLRCDEEIKTGRLAERLALERFILESVGKQLT